MDYWVSDFNKEGALIYVSLPRGAIVLVFKMWSERDTFEKGKYWEKYQQTGLGSKQSTTGAELNQAGAHLGGCSHSSVFLMKSEFSKEVSLLIQLWQAPGHGVTGLVWPWDRGQTCSFSGSFSCPVSSALTFFISQFFWRRSRNSSLTPLPQIPGLVTCVLSSGGFCNT